MIRTILAICTLIWAGFATAGAWDTGPFANDDALDWVWELSESNDLSVIETTLKSAASSSGYLEAPTELAQLWMDSEELMDSWLKDLDDLLKRLQ